MADISGIDFSTDKRAKSLKGNPETHDRYQIKQKN